jgi:eukaryotic-like serine/threonine-protein kinase
MQAPEILGGRYQLLGILGRGGMAEVRDAWDLRLGRSVAVKLLYPSVSLQPECRRRLMGGLLTAGLLAVVVFAALLVAV